MTLITNTNNIIEVNYDTSTIKKIVMDHTTIFENRKCNCKQLLEAGYTTSGVYTIYPSKYNSIDVYCDMTTDGGGWTLISKSKVNTDNINYTNFYSGQDVQLLNSLDVLSMPLGESHIGINQFDIFDFTMAKLTFTAKSSNTGVTKTAPFYKTITKNNVNTWFTSNSREPDATTIAINYALTNQATTRPFDNDYQNNGSLSGETVMLWGADLGKHGYTKTSYHPFHGPGGGWCSTTGDADNNNWPDDYADGHWGNALTIMFK